MKTLIVGDYKISKSEASIGKNIAWIENKDGEGTEVDLDKWFNKIL